MKKQIILSFLMFTLFFMYGSLAHAATTEEVIVLFKNGIDEQVITSYGGEIEDRVDSIHAAKVKIASDAMTKLKQDPSIMSVEENSKVYAKAQRVDWGYEQIQAPRATSQQLTGKNVKVAVVDSGISSHPDLKLAGGISFTSSSSNNYNDDNGHGTHVAGIIAAQNNDIGILGIAPDVQLYAVKVLNNRGVGNVFSMVGAIQWCIDQGIDVINLSLTSEEDSEALRLILQKAYEKNIVIVSAVGNDGREDTSIDTVEYPAKYPFVIGVGAVDRYHQRPSFSATGQGVELVAPGVGVYSTYLNGSYATMEGTSMATPYVTGCIALLKEAVPSYTPEQIRAVLHQTAIDIGAYGMDTVYGYGFVQVPYFEDLHPAAPMLQASLTQASIYKNKIQLSWNQTAKSQATYVIYRNGQRIDTVTNTDHYTDFVDPGNYQYEVEVQTLFGTSSNKSNVATVQVPKVESNTQPFVDINGNEWYTSAIEFLQNKQIITGFPDGTFKANMPVTRGEAVTMIIRALDVPLSEQLPPFKDVADPYFATPYIETAYEQNIVTGYTDGNFYPNRNVIRGHMALMLARAMKLEEMGTERFLDVPKTSVEYTAVHQLAYAKVARGFEDGRFYPDQSLTRGQMAMFIARMLDPKFITD